MPTREELVAHGRDNESIRAFIGADVLIYQDIAAMKRAVGMINPLVEGFEASCFDGRYITGDVSIAEFAAIETQRSSARRSNDEADDSEERTRLTLQSATN
jgi:amidophosphoribosyltransferase